MSIEREVGLDSAMQYYEKAFALCDDSLYFGTPHLEVLLFGKEFATNWINKYKNSDELTALQLLNDIKNDVVGLNNLFPMFFHDDYTNNYFLRVPDSLYDSGIINSMDKIELYYAKMGVNIDAMGSGHKSKSFHVFTTGLYRDNFESTNTFEIIDIESK